MAGRDKSAPTPVGKTADLALFYDQRRALRSCAAEGVLWKRSRVQRHAQGTAATAPTSSARYAHCHMVGDIHQPLHVANAAQGSNEVKVNGSAST